MRIVILGFLLAVGVAWGGEPPLVAHTRSELVAEPAWVRPGVPFTVAVRQRLEPEWHTYWRNPGEAGRPLRVNWRLPAGWTAGPLRWPVPKQLSPPPVVDYGYADEVWFLAEVTPPAAAPAGPVTVAAELSWLVCRTECMPGATTVEQTLVVKPDPAPPLDARFVAARAALPRSWPAGWRTEVRNGVDSVELQVVPGAVPAGWVPLALETILFFPDAPGWLDTARPIRWRWPVSGGLSASLPRVADSAPPAAAGGLLAAWRDAAGAPVVLEMPAVTGAVDNAVPPVKAAAATASPPAPNPAAADDWRALAPAFRVAARASGYLEAKPFLAFLDQGVAGGGALAEPSGLERLGVWALVLAVLAGGLALNLTPCVLPLIPVNLAIIGAGTRAGGSRRRGFLLGGAYGLGMALAYGGLGLAAVLTGARFGGLNASPWFNGAMALLFVLLTLAMFGVFELDFTRFRRTGPAAGAAKAPGSLAGRVWTAFVLGLVAALLAGACVAPVVVSVLLLAGRLHAAGNPAGLLLPFLLGVGMALPWPLAGAGLALLPKPGRWMVWVKQAFGVLILVLAVYYGHLAWTLARGPAAAGAAAAGAGAPDAVLAAGLRRALAEHRPVMIDFWASWCKNCLVMEETTFRDPAVRQRLEREFIVVKYQAEQMDRLPAKAVLDHYGVPGLPTYLILQPIQ
jgi:DsbC/DsbD-like thiol-disulfide interchange protein/cytochrome c biogenesis protein CcdA/thiol-disulfide isomerase/thioredoxin